MKLPFAALALCLAAAASAQTAVSAPAAPDPVFTAAQMRAHVDFLADDLLEGRDIGSRGHEIAARYVASRFEALGLKPGGDNGGWFQTITFQQTDRTDTPGTITVRGPGGEKSWTHGTDALIWLPANGAKEDVSAPLVFVGYGVEDSRLGINDYAGLDVKGKIVVALRGYPKGLPSEEGAHVSATKVQAAQAHGAIGMLSVGTILSMKTRPWARMVQFADEPDFSWVDKDDKPFNEAPGIRVSAMLNDPAVAAVFAGAPRSIAAIRAAADKDGGRPKGFALKTSAHVVVEGRGRRVTSPNVVGILPGSDPALAAQYVALSAHLDHIGISKAKAEDKPVQSNAAGGVEGTGTDYINNGALDNAAGVATMLEVARAMAQAPVKPRRSIIFIASTGEEKGLLGADYFARHPSVPIASIVGNVDLDMPLLLYRFTDLTAFGADHSTLGPIVAKAVAPMGVTLSPDPMPQEGIFTRSDHYMFVKQGVPAVFLATGYANGGEKAWGEFLSGNYHHPGDDMKQAIDWEAGARFAEANYRITRAMADDDAPPMWFKGDFFGDTFAPTAAKADKAGK